MFDVRRLRLLRDLARHGTIAATAQAGNLTPSAVSQQLATLEREVRAPLFLRDGRRLVLTQAAEVLVEHTERVLADLEAAEAAMAGLRSGTGGVVRLGAFPTGASAIAAPAIAACRDSCPDLRVLLEERETSEALSGLRGGQLDVALVYSYSLLPEVDAPGVHLTELLTEPMLLALGPRHPTSAAGVVRLAELADATWIAPDSDPGLRSMLERACGRAGFAPVIDFHSDDYTVMLALVRAGLGVTLVPRLAVESVGLDLRFAHVADTDLFRRVHVAVRRGGETHPAVRAVADALATAASGLPAVGAPPAADEWPGAPEGPG